MQIMDFHIHSKYSRATSRDMDLNKIAEYSKIKGLSVVATGDCTHSKWREDIKKLEFSDGLYEKDGMKFIVSGEISTIYKQGDKVRKIHHCLLLPSVESAEQITEKLARGKNLDYDGRPILGITSPEIVEKIIEIEKKAIIFPAHIWTPWFGVLGSKSGFDSLEECYQDQMKHIFAYETGLSSDPEMNSKISFLNDVTLLSNSDCHSFWPWRIGREANVFSLKKINYDEIYDAIKHNKIDFTIEVDPSYGKYHLDGHRNCNVCLEPKESIELNNICPKCNRPLTIGVLHRVEELTNQEITPKKSMKLLPLHEVISTVKNKGVATKISWDIYNKFIEKFGNEYNILIDAEISEISEIDPDIGEVVKRMREKNIEVSPGYDGEYGKLVLKKTKENLFDFFK